MEKYLQPPLLINLHTSPKNTNNSIGSVVIDSENNINWVINLHDEPTYVILAEELDDISIINDFGEELGSYDIKTMSLPYNILINNVDDYNSLTGVRRPYKIIFRDQQRPQGLTTFVESLTYRFDDIGDITYGFYPDAKLEQVKFANPNRNESKLSFVHFEYGSAHTIERRFYHNDPDEEQRRVEVFIDGKLQDTLLF